ncbi:hexamerin-1.1-like [Phymastichus coffea]|uniref:hexamerin-1.1-like n=1 Tax=Phymastichus coffea TaxID=108790 RepID=UPI00273CAA94|nr:hexamerin-1.1-like [Phymastichus coffea]
MLSITMQFSIVFLTLFAFGTAIPTTPQLRAADQELLKKQQDVIYLLENIAGELPYEAYRDLGYKYEFEPYLQNYENPTVVKYYVGLVKTGHVQPKGIPYSYSVSQLRKEVSLLTQIFMGAKDYETFLNTAAWARIYINQEQFVTAYSSAVLRRHDMQGVVLPPVYEIFPNYFFDTRIIQKVQDFVMKYGYDYYQGEKHRDYYDIYVNYTSYYPFGENQIAYFTEDIGLACYYSYVQLAGYMLPYGQYEQKYGKGEESKYFKNGHGAHYYYIHEQLLARYNLERLSQGLEPIRELDYYYEHIETPYKPHLRYLNGVNMPGRDEHHYVTAHHHNYELIKVLRLMERRILDAIDQGYFITPQGTFMSLYQPEGLSILGELIEGTGHSINPRYYGAYAQVARQFFGYAPEFNNIWEYQPSALELGYTAVRDPMFYQLYSKILEFFHYYQESLPAYQYNDVVLPGVNIEKVEVSDLVTYFGDYQVYLDNAVPQPVGKKQEQQPFPHIRAHLKRLDHKQFEYTIYTHAEKPVRDAVVRVYVGPKYNYNGQPIDINVHRHYFYEIDQFVYDLAEGKNVIVRNSHQATGQSYDYPSVYELKDRLGNAFLSQHPYYISEPEQLYGFPARLSLPKGTKEGYPLQFFVIISGSYNQPEYYGSVVSENFQTYQPQHYHVVDYEQYEQYARNPVDKVNGAYQAIEVVPDYDAHIITEGNWHWGYLYKKYPGSYYYPHWQQTHYQVKSGGYGQHYPNSQYGARYGVAYGEKYAQKYPESYHHYGKEEFKYPHAYHKVVDHPEIGKSYQTIYKQGSYESVEYPGSGHYPGAKGLYSSYPTGSFKSYKGQEEYVHNYYSEKYISDVIGGVVSLDGRPFGYPLDRQLAHSAFYAKNIYVKNVVIYHDEEYFYEY